MFELPLKNLDTGTYEYSFEVDDAFFEANKNGLIKKGAVVANATVEINPDLIIFTLDHQGFMETACDRCLEQIRLPISGHGQILVKIVDEPQREDEVVYLQRDSEKLDLAPLINEMITIALPIVKTYDCELEEVTPCNQEVLNRLGRSEETSDVSSSWEELKRLKLK